MISLNKPKYLFPLWIFSNKPFHSLSRLSSCNVTAPFRNDCAHALIQQLSVLVLRYHSQAGFRSYRRTEQHSTRFPGVQKNRELVHYQQQQKLLGMLAIELYKCSWLYDTNRTTLSAFLIDFYQLTQRKQIGQQQL